MKQILQAIPILFLLAISHSSFAQSKPGDRKVILSGKPEVQRTTSEVDPVVTQSNTDKRQADSRPVLTDANGVQSLVAPQYINPSTAPKLDAVAEPEK